MRSAIDADDRTVLAQALAYMQAMGVDCAVREAPVDWILRGDQALVPVAQFVSERHDAAAATAPSAPQPGAETKSAPGSRQAAPGAETVAQRRVPGLTETKPQVQPLSSTSGPASPSPGPSTSSGVTDGAKALADAKDLAASAATLDGLAAALAGYDGCPLKKTARKLCFYRGAEQSRVMLIGEGPGRDEDASGKPFVGRAGQLLDRMLAAIGLDETTVHITNVVYWRPPGNRAPTELEALVCRPFLERQIQLVDPEVVVAIGGSAAKALLETKSGIMRMRGQWRTVTLGGRPRQTIATLHPAYLLRTPAAKKMAWRDLLEIEAALKTDTNLPPRTAE